MDVCYLKQSTIELLRFMKTITNFTLHSKSITLLHSFEIYLQKKWNELHMDSAVQSDKYLSSDDLLGKWPSINKNKLNSQNTLFTTFFLALKRSKYFFYKFKNFQKKYLCCIPPCHLLTYNNTRKSNFLDKVLPTIGSPINKTSHNYINAMSYTHSSISSLATFGSEWWQFWNISDSQNVRNFLGQNDDIF